MTNEDIEVSNAKEEIQEIIDKCNSCGLCKELDPVFRVLKEESLSPRGLAALFSKNQYTKDIFNYSLCGICKEKCPFNIDIDAAVRKARKILNLRNKEDKENKKLLEKTLNKENPFSDWSAIS